MRDILGQRRHQKRLKRLAKRKAIWRKEEDSFGGRYRKKPNY